MAKSERRKTLTKLCTVMYHHLKCPLYSGTVIKTDPKLSFTELETGKITT